MSCRHKGDLLEALVLLSFAPVRKYMFFSNWGRHVGGYARLGVSLRICGLVITTFGWLLS